MDSGPESASVATAVTVALSAVGPISCTHRHVDAGNIPFVPAIGDTGLNVNEVTGGVVSN